MLNPEGIQYYAHSVIKSEIFQVTRRDDPDRYLHVIALSPTSIWDNTRQAAIRPNRRLLS
jgi:hypothetical protein